MAGITSTGFERKTLEDIRTDWEASFKASFGEEIDVEPASVFGQLIGILSEREALLWELMEETYNSQYPDSASGSSLVNVCAITGTTPNPATKSTVTVTCTGTPATLISAGRIFQVQNNGARFVTLEDATIGGGGTVDVDCEAEETGPKVANAGTLTVIVTAVAGLTSITNAEDANLGEDLETDGELRLRREQEVRAAGKGSVEAIRQDVLAVDNVESCLVFENVTDTTDGDGVPAHSIEVVTLDDGESETEQAIYEAIFDSKAAGVRTYGTESGTVTDSEGNSHTVYRSPATEKWVWLTVAVTKDTSTSLTNSEIQTNIKNAIVAWAEDEYALGDDVVTAKLDFPIWRDAPDGVADVGVTSNITAVGAGEPSYNSSNKTIAAREIARFDTSRITVNVT